MSEEMFAVPFPVQDEESMIWRYMDFTKFVSLLDRASLFLCRADRLEDPFEGSSTEADVDFWKSDFYRRKIVEGKMGYAKMQENLNDISKGSN